MLPHVLFIDADENCELSAILKIRTNATVSTKPSFQVAPTRMRFAVQTNGI